MADNHPLHGRFLKRAVLAALGDTPVVLIHGARQCGKSTLARQIAATDHPAQYITLDDAAVLSAIKADAAGFLAGFDGPVVLDEIQRAPELFVALKAAVDRNRTAGRYLLTGSANVLALPRLSDSLAGRMEVLTLWPFSEGELADTRTSFIDAVFGTSPPTSGVAASDVFSRILRGGFPPAVERTDPDRRRAWFGSYILTILERDVREIAQIENLTALSRVLTLVAARVATLLNFAELARNMAIPQTTLKRYFALLEVTFLTRTVPPWSTNLGQRLIKTPKLFLNDTGLAVSLLGLTEDRLRHEALLRGGLLENFVALELLKQAGWSAVKTQLFHFRTASGQEVDFLLETNAGAIVGIEVKASATVTGHDFNGLRALAAMTGSRFHRGIVFYTGTEIVPFGANLYALPVDALWNGKPAAI
jgi:predicted AAA+ superfamily ATPase